MMTPEPQLEFAQLVQHMRDVQRQYFRTRAKSVLAESKGLEAKVDAALAGMDLPKSATVQLAMFKT